MYLSDCWCKKNWHVNLSAKLFHLISLCFCWNCTVFWALRDWFLGAGPRGWPSDFASAAWDVVITCNYHTPSKLMSPPRSPLRTPGLGLLSLSLSLSWLPLAFGIPPWGSSSLHQRDHGNGIGKQKQIPRASVIYHRSPSKAPYLPPSSKHPTRSVFPDPCREAMANGSPKRARERLNITEFATLDFLLLNMRLSMIFLNAPGIRAHTLDFVKSPAVPLSVRERSIIQLIDNGGSCSAELCEVHQQMTRASHEWFPQVCWDVTRRKDAIWMPEIVTWFGLVLAGGCLMRLQEMR